ncbi:MAG: phosphate ABC transporter permease subunit PstC [Phycisphaerae bacterium]|nr:phosphate ABC transporter permease subunit PstC [Phycisphaerae bacterium]
MNGPAIDTQSPLTRLTTLGSPRSRAWRDAKEFLVRLTLIACTSFSLVITALIIAILAFQSARFFAEVSLAEFLLTTEWSPLLGESKSFGIWPLVAGTLLVTLVAAVFALPVGLVTAIYLSEYAPSRVRSILKPVLEVLAGIPTVVYGFFAVIIIAPSLQSVSKFFLGESIFGAYSAAAAGIAVGIMILPIVTSLSEDALRAVPRGLRDSAYALGSTRFDTSVRVVVPGALGGIMASYLLAITRAIGETMIVALAAGGLAQLTILPWDSVQTMTGYMVLSFLGDAPATGVEYKSSFAVAGVLFLLTLGLTLTGYRILARFREEYE